MIRLVGAVLTDIHDEWQASDRRYLSEGSMAKLYDRSDTDTSPPSRRRIGTENHLKPTTRGKSARDETSNYVIEGPQT